MPKQKSFDWLETPPVDCEYRDRPYHLLMDGKDGSSIQAIAVSRKEFISLKLRLAELRGKKREVKKGSLNASA